MAGYLELSFPLDGLTASEAEAACFATGALSVTLSDAGDDPLYEPRPGEQPLWPATRVQALYAGEDADAGLVVELARSLGVDTEALTARAVADRIWEREWLRDFHAMRFGKRLWVCPRHETVAESGAAVVRLDPGLAFGTGTHPSTAQCLNWLEQHAGANPARFARLRMIDYGCGSGILALAALALGAERVWAYDIDPQALEATRQNALDNGLAARLSICSTETQLPRGVHLLVANILGTILVPLAGRFAALLAPRGELLLAGLLAPEGSRIAEAFAKWFDMQEVAQREGWIALGGTRVS